MTPDIAQIYAQYKGKVMGYISARVNNHADAEDLCADVFEKIMRRLSTFDDTKASVSTWVFTITRNTVIDHFRRGRPGSELDENLVDDSGVDEGLLNSETLTQLANALTKLPEQLRDIIVLRYYDGKPLTEIAEMMNLSYGAVKLRHQNALMLLREQFSD
ncbi:MAG: sigma-70 family RNA polymerase sigma factor [Clostridia bacterium]|nr:sigma-70 family RNA polymerase sigma factor [Clostridia bacterium]